VAAAAAARNGLAAGDAVHGVRNRGREFVVVGIFPTHTYEEIEYFDV